MTESGHMDFVVGAVLEAIKGNGVHGYAETFLILTATLNRVFEDSLLPNQKHIPKEIIDATRLFLTGVEHEQ